MSEHQPPESSEPTLPRDPYGGDLHAGRIAPEVSRRVSSILDAVEREAARLRDDAIQEARRYLDYSRRHADSLVEERRHRIAELSDEIVAKSEAVVARLDDAEPVREGFQNLVRSLGGVAERLARESEGQGPRFEPPDFHDPAVQRHAVPPQPTPAASPPAPQAAHPPPPRPAHAPPEQPTEWRPAAPPAAASPATESARPPHGSTAVPHGQAPFAGGSEMPPGQDEARTAAIQMASGGRTRREVREHLDAAFATIDTARILDELFGPGSGEDARAPWTSFGR